MAKKILLSIPSVVSGKELQSSLADSAEKITAKAIVDETFGMELSLFYRLVKQ